MNTVSRAAEYKRVSSKYFQMCSTRCMVVVNISRLLHVTSACAHPERTTLPKSVQKYMWHHGCARYTGSLFKKCVCVYTHCVYVYVYVYVYLYLKIVNYHSINMQFFNNKKLKKYKSDIKESDIRLFFGPRGLSYAPFATSGGMKTTE